MSIALIAGTGGLPPLLADLLEKQGTPPVICEMRGFPSQVADRFERVPFRLETLGSLLDDLRRRGVTTLCLAGAVKRPSVDPGAIDAATAPLIPRLVAAMQHGDDGTLRALITLFEEHGFAVRAAHEIAPQLLPKTGVHTQTQPGMLDATLAVARAALVEMAAADLGQCLLLRDGSVLAREDDRGTDVLLATPGIAGSLFVKAPKPGQSLLADMPLIGPETARAVAAAGLIGIVIADGGVMALDLPQIVRVLDEHGLFLKVGL